MIAFEQSERLDLLDKLEDHGLFIKALWSLSDLYFTDRISTAAVSLKNDRITMMFNETFWRGLPERAQMFVVCHEQLHIMSNHFERMRFGDGDSRNKNIAADISINHMLIRNYFFEKDDLPEWEKYCWVETVFPDQDVCDNETTEYYYMLIKQREDKGEPINGEPLDDHNHDIDTHPAPLSDTIKKAIKAGQRELKDKLKSDDDGSQSTDQPADLASELDKVFSQGVGFQEHTTKKAIVPAWKTLYKKIPKSILDERSESHWINRNRSHHLLSRELSMPGELEIDFSTRVKVLIYLDTSGSCVNHAKHFLTSAITLPSTLYDVEMFGFCADVYSIPNNPPYKLYGFGAESFQAIEDHAESFQHVDAIMVFTDGYSKQITHANPKKWHWFLTPDGTAEYLDNRVKHYNLEQYGWMSRADS